VDFHCNYQFEYVRDIGDLSRLYLEYKGDHAETFDYYAACKIRDVLSQFSAFEVNQKRELVSQSMESAVKEELASKGAVVTAFQLLKVVLPQAVKAAIDETQAVEESVRKAFFDLSRARINGETKRLTAKIDASLTLVTADAEAESIINQANAEAAAITRQLESEKTAFDALHEKLKASSTMAGWGVDELLAYISADSMLNSGVGEVSVAIDGKV
jgi:regulator of protease activity HflC (stomatin/prohibitin superfamily)